MDENNPLVSVCMPAYNAGKFIAAAITSVVNQSYQNWELIIVNDGSADDTVNEIEKFTDHRIKLYQQNNRGQCAAANNAFGFSAGQLIKFMDADDLISANCIRNQVASLHGSENNIAFAAWGRFYNDDLDTFELVTSPLNKNSNTAAWLIESMTGKEVMLQCGLWLIPRSILNRSGLWNEKLSLINDFEFFIRVLLCADELKFTDDAVLYYRSGIGQSLSATKSAAGALSAFNSIDWGTQHLLKYENSTRVKKLSADCFQRFVYNFYPQHKTLTELAEQKIRELGGSALPFPAGGYTRILANIIGWKATKNLKSLIKSNAQH